MAQNKYYGDTGMDSLAVGGNSPVYSFLTSAMASGKALADDGKAYDSVQTAENNASSFVLVGPGTFNESVTIDTAGLTLVGAGYDTSLTGDSDPIVDVTVNDVTVRNLRVGNSSYDGISGSNGRELTVDNCWVTDANSTAITPSTDAIITNCHVSGSGNRGIGGTTRAVIANCLVENCASAGIRVHEDTVVANCVVKDNGGHGINVPTYDCIIIGCRVINSGDDGIYLDGTTADNIVANVRISGSTNQSADDDGTSNVTNNFKTGAAN